MKENNRLIFHVDVNSAYLSWEAAYRLQHGDSLDLREIPSVIGGDEESRHGIVLAKSMAAKRYNIKTGETLFSARTKCPEVKIVPPRYGLYIQCSNAMDEILKQYTPMIQRFSVDESFMDFSNMSHLYKDQDILANTISERIKNELGFTVNIGISSNKLLAKMASDFQKPDRIHTLFPNEIKEKMWPLPVEDLFMVGRATVSKLHNINIFTIGDLANYDFDKLTYLLKSQGALIWRFANGIDTSKVKKSNYISAKGMGNSTTMSYDVVDKKDAKLVLLSLCETIGIRLRNSGNCCRVVTVNIKESNFISYSHRKKLYTPTDSTKKIWDISANLFDEVWQGKAIRHFGVHVSELCTNEFYQECTFGDKDREMNRAIDTAMDNIRIKYGSTAVFKSSFLYSGIKPMCGGVGEGDYPIMTSML